MEVPVWLQQANAAAQQGLPVPYAKPTCALVLLATTPGLVLQEAANARACGEALLALAAFAQQAAPRTTNAAAMYAETGSASESNMHPICGMLQLQPVQCYSTGAAPLSVI